MCRYRKHYLQQNGTRFNFNSCALSQLLATASTKLFSFMLCSELDKVSYRQSYY